LRIYGLVYFIFSRNNVFCSLCEGEGRDLAGVCAAIQFYDHTGYEQAPNASHDHSAETGTGCEQAHNVSV